MMLLATDGVRHAIAGLQAYSYLALVHLTSGTIFNTNRTVCLLMAGVLFIVLTPLMPRNPTRTLSTLKAGRGRHTRLHRGPQLPITMIILCTINLRIGSEAARNDLLMVLTQFTEHPLRSIQGYPSCSRINYSPNRSQISKGRTCSNCLTGRLSAAGASHTNSTSEKLTLGTETMSSVLPLKFLCTSAEEWKTCCDKQLAVSMLTDVHVKNKHQASRR